MVNHERSDPIINQPTYRLRNERRLNTRSKLIESAGTLMSTRGFEETTIQQIADHAGTHVQTLYAHFPNKYALCAAAAVQSLRVALASRDSDTVTFWRGWVQTMSRETLKGDCSGGFLNFVRDTQTKPQHALVTRMMEHEYMEVLAESLAEDYSMDAKLDLRPKVVAQMMLTASAHSIQRWQDEGAGFDLVGCQVDSFEEVVAIVESMKLR